MNSIMDNTSFKQSQKAIPIHLTVDLYDSFGRTDAQWHKYDIADAGLQVRSGTWAMPHRSGVGDAVGLGVTCGIADVGASPVRQAR